jgi:Rab5 GDP/GTP exchange factor
MQAQTLAVAQNNYPASRTGTPTAGLDIQGLQAEIDAAHSRAADAARGTLIQIFPAVDREVIEWVLEANEGDLGRSIEALLEIGAGGE